MPQGTVVVGIASSEVLHADPDRAALLVQNLSANDVWIQFGGPAVAGKGLHLVPNQPVPIILDGRIFQGEITGSVNAIASAAGSPVFGIDATFV